MSNQQPLIDLTEDNPRVEIHRDVDECDCCCNEAPPNWSLWITVILTFISAFIIWLRLLLIAVEHKYS